MSTFYLESTEEQIAEEYGVPIETLMDWRNREWGPQYRRTEEGVRYNGVSTPKWFEDWLQSYPELEAYRERTSARISLQG